jgi:hypothetical protein
MTGHVGQRVEIRYLPHDRTFIEVFRDGRHLFTAMPQSTLTADQQQEHIQKRAEERRLAQQRFTVANRQRRSNAVGPVHRLTVDKDGNRLVTAPPDDLLDGGGAALAELIGDSSPQQRLF